MEKCIIGLYNNDDCHKNSFCRLSGFYQLSDMNDTEIDLLRWRTGIDNLNPGDQICFHHEKMWLSRYSSLHKYCADPFSRHKKKITKSLYEVDESLAQDMKLNVKPGQKLCPTCVNIAKSKAEVSSTDSDEAYDVSNISRDSLNTSASLLGVSPIKSVPDRYKVAYGKRKAHQISSAVSQKIQKALNIDCSVEKVNSARPCEQCKDFSDLMELLTQKCKSSTRSEQIRILTLAPPSWSIGKVAATFGVTEHMVRVARKLKDSSGVLASRERRSGQKMLPETVKQKVVEFYENDKFSRLCAGRKDCVSVKIHNKKIQMQKRLLLVNLKELYIEFSKHHVKKIGFSKFCELRPKWCIPVGSKASHSVCVCQYHQNVKLMWSVVPEHNSNYKILLENCVCDTHNRNCMMRVCSQCPGKDAVQEFIAQKFEMDLKDDDDIINFRKWMHTDRTTIVTLQLSISEFCKNLAEMVDDLRQHHYIAKVQSSYLQYCKENLAHSEILVILDFAENYSFLVQDEVQGYHWDNSQSTLHPFVVYYKCNESVKSLSMCCISDHLQHNTTAVHVFLRHFVSRIKLQLADRQIKKIIYFSDGAASQYKNYKNLTNLTYHQEDFGIEAEWHFFATCHGKSPCDGIGGTVKRLARRASLQATSPSNYILTPENLYTWSLNKIQGINMFFVSSQEIKSYEGFLEDRCSAVKTVPGTRSHHAFLVTATNTIVMKRLSTDANGTTVAMGTPENSPFEQLQVGQYVAFKYDEKWYIGYISQVSHEFKDVEIICMSPAESQLLKWPSRKDTVWVPFSSVICKVNVPSLQSNSARLYKIDDKCYEKILSLTFK